MISGGLAGGSTEEKVGLFFLANLGLSIWDTLEAVILLCSALAARAAGFLLMSHALWLMSAVVGAFAFCTYMMTINLMWEYMMGDEKSGERLVQETLVNLAATIGVTALSALAAPILRGRSEK